MRKRKKKHEEKAAPEEASADAPGLWTPGDELPPEAEAAAGLVEGESAEAEGEAAPEEEKEPLSEVETLKDRLARAHAETANAAKRASRERERARLLAQRDVVAALLPGLDSLALALNHADDDAPTGGGEATLRDGVRLAYDDLVKALAAAGLRPIVAAPGGGFDPTLHEAVTSIETADAPAGSIIEVLRPGYLFHEFVIRAAQVVVARAPTPPPAAEPAPESEAPPEAPPEGE